MVRLTLYARVGGKDWFVQLVDRFYDAVAMDPVLRPIYPDDLAPARTHLASFLVQYWGGPAEYEAERGHPRLRRRHAPFGIGEVERDAWLTHMTAAVRAGGLPPRDEAEMLTYFDHASFGLINSSVEKPL